MTATVTEPPLDGGQDIETRTLTGTDRCDKCGPSARAYVRVIFTIEGEQRPLDFCGSCFARREPLLADMIESKIVTVIDEREFIKDD